ncbi:MAG: nucleotidyltransferase domain-containing protein [Candidatus Bathyarchaeia archaeon]
MFDKASFEILYFMRKRETARFRDLRGIVKNPRTLSIKLRKLRDLGLIGWDDGIYKLTEKGLKVSRILEELSRNLRSPAFNVKNIEKIPHRCFAPVIEKYCGILGKLLGDRLVSVMLFGSVARGEWDRDSDIDILVIVEGWNGAPVWERVKELRRAKEELEGSLEYRDALKAGYWPIIQNYPLSVEEAKRFNRIYLDAVIEGIILYDKDDFLARILRSLRDRLEEMGSMRVTLPNREVYWVLKDMEAGEIINFG